MPSYLRGGALALVVADDARKVVAELLGAGQIDGVQGSQALAGNATRPVEQGGREADQRDLLKQFVTAPTHGGRQMGNSAPALRSQQV